MIKTGDGGVDRNYFILRHRIAFNRAMRIISFVLKTIILMTSFFAILWFSKIMLVSNSGTVVFNTAFSTEYINKSGLLSAQITPNMCFFDRARIKHPKEIHIW